MGIKDFDDVYWTLRVEMLFYISILFLYLFKFLKNSDEIGVVASVLIVIMMTFFPDHIISQKIFNIFTLCQFLPLFTAGIIFFKLIKKQNKILKSYILLSICLGAQILLFPYAGRSRWFISQTEYVFILFTYFLLFALFVHGKLMWIKYKPLLFFGKISYALYLIHNFVSVSFIIPFLTSKLQLNYWVSAFVITLPVVIILATLITYYIEGPFSRILKARLRKFALKAKVIST